MKSLRPTVALAGILAAATPSTFAGFTLFEATGANPAAILPKVDSFRAALGTLNANQPVEFTSGRREINWDGVPDNFSEPNLFPGNFFNGTTVGRARGIEFSTPGTGFFVSADSSNPTSTPPSFGYPSDFVPFSAQRLFAPLASLITDITFFSAGTTDPATVSGFGAVFSDVEIANLTSLAAYDLDDNLLFSRNIGVAGNGGLSFLGIQADAGERIARIRLTTGDIQILGSGIFSPGSDTVVMDDFIYAEPQAVVPEARTTLAGLISLSAAAGYIIRRRRA